MCTLWGGGEANFEPDKEETNMTIILNLLLPLNKHINKTTRNIFSTDQNKHKNICFKTKISIHQFTYPYTYL